MNRMEDIRKELERGEQAEREGNSGRARVCARRAAGIALEDYYARMGKDPRKDAMKLMEQFAGDPAHPKEVLEAVHRLSERVRPDFTSSSRHPLDDARILISYLSTH